MKCNACGTDLIGELRFCPHCGEKLASTKGFKCDNCDEVLESRWKFCPMCGASQQAIEVSKWDNEKVICGVCKKKNNCANRYNRGFSDTFAHICAEQKVTCGICVYGQNCARRYYEKFSDTFEHPCGNFELLLIHGYSVV
jgi:RNA polymerase subunit RPABC4/transcription elongation factor Spt4